MLQRLIFILMSGLSIPASAQQDLKGIHDKVVNPYLKVEELDLLVPSLKKITADPVNTDQQRLLFETFRLATERYASNNHFKQAYLLFQDYLSLKEKFLSREKASVITEAALTYAKKQQELNAGIKQTASEIARLQSEMKQADSRNLLFIRNAALLFLAMTAVFIFLFMRLSIKLQKAKEEIRQYQGHLLLTEKMALLGRLSQQVSMNSQQNMDIIRNEIAVVQELFKKMEPLLAVEQLPVLQAIEDSYRKAAQDLKKIKPAAPVLPEPA